MKKTILIFATVLTLGVSCSKEIVKNDTPAVRSSFAVSIPMDTKVAIGDKSGGVYPIAWEAGDRLVIDGTALTNPLDAAYAGAKEAVFTTTEKVEYPVTLVYPGEVKGNAQYIVVPAEQNYQPGRLAGGCGIMVAHIIKTGDTAEMKQACGFIRVPVTGNARIVSAALTALGGEFVAGRFSVNPQTAELTHVDSPASSPEGSSRITLLGETQLSSTATVYYFAIPAGTYAEGFRFTLKDSEGKMMSKTLYTASGKTVAAGVVTEMPQVEYVAGADESDIFSVSETEVEFGAYEYEASDIRVVTTEEDVTVAATGLEWLKCEFPETIPAGRTLVLNAVPSAANVSEEREGTLTFTGKTSGTVKTVGFSQADMYKGVDGFPALWEISASQTCVTSGAVNAYGKEWKEKGIATALRGKGAGCAYVSAGSTSGRTLNYSIDISSSTKTLGVGGMGEGDYILFSVPATSIPAGTDFDFMLTINANTTGAPKYWLFEWWDGGEWKHDENGLYTAKEDGKTKYSFYIQHFSSANHRTFIKSFTLANAVENDFVKMRIRAVGNINGSGKTLTPTASALVYLATSTYQACNIVCYKDAPAIKDRTKIMQLGNSFTYYFGSAFKLKEMCRRAGHQTEVHINVKGSQEFEHHMQTLVFSQEVVEEGGYAKAIIQDGSYFHAEYGAGSTSSIVGVTPKYSPEQILALTKEMGARIRKYSPDADIILESVWSYSRKAAGDNYLGFGSYENFDAYQWKGSTEIAAQSPDINWLSPIGKAFANARTNYGFTSAYNYLNYTDNYHDSREGAYLKACVNYLILFGEDFGANAPDCDLAPADAAKLRQAAKDIVMADRESFHIR